MSYYTTWYFKNNSSKNLKTTSCIKNYSATINQTFLEIYPKKLEMNTAKNLKTKNISTLCLKLDFQICFLVMYAVNNNFNKYFVRKFKVAIIFMKNSVCIIQTINLNKRNCLIQFDLYSYTTILLCFTINITYLSRLSTFEKFSLIIMPKSKIEVVPIFLLSQNICLSQYYKVIYIKLLSWVK